MSEWVNEWVSEWVNEWVSEWVNEWMSEWVSEWMSEWVNEQTISVCIHHGTKIHNISFYIESNVYSHTSPFYIVHEINYL